MKIVFHHVESHMNPRGEQVLMNAVEVLECREYERYAIHNVWDFLLCYLCKLVQARNFIVIEAHFHAESFGAGPIVIALKTAKLFNFYHLQTQCHPTIVSVVFSWGRLEPRN